MIKDILQKLIRQAKPTQKSPEIQHNFNRATRRLSLSQRDIITDLRQFFSGLNTQTARRVYQYLYFMATQHQFVYPSQERIGDFADVTDRTVRRILELLKRHSLIKVHNRGYNSCVYILPPELFSLKVMKQLEDVFGFLKRVTLLALFLSGRPMDSRNVLLVSQDNLNLLNINKLTVERGTLKVEISTKRNTVNQLITSVNQNISASIRLNELGMIINSAFDDETLQIGYDEWKELKDPNKKTHAYYFGICRNICKRMKKTPNYSQMTLAVSMAGYKPGDRTMLSDPDAQPRYDNIIDLQRKKFAKPIDSPKTTETVHPGQSYWLKMFPPTEHILNNDKDRQ